jgi:hypothetical protein
LKPVVNVLRNEVTRFAFLKFVIESKQCDEYQSGLISDITTYGKNGLISRSFFATNIYSIILKDNSEIKRKIVSRENNEIIAKESVESKGFDWKNRKKNARTVTVTVTVQSSGQVKSDCSCGYIISRRGPCRHWLCSRITKNTLKH